MVGSASSIYTAGTSTKLHQGIFFRKVYRPRKGMMKMACNLKANASPKKNTAQNGRSTSK